MFALDSFREDDGNVESVIVMIPLIFLFLSVLQIASAVLVHGISLNRVQGEISNSSLLQGEVPRKLPTFLLQKGSIELPGGGHLLIGVSDSELVPISPLAVGHTHLTTRAIAIDEN